jgi:hypothetical protein
MHEAVRGSKALNSIRTLDRNFNILEEREREKERKIGNLDQIWDSIWNGFLIELDWAI